MTLLQNEPLKNKMGKTFDYQSEWHCSKTSYPSLSDIYSAMMTEGVSGSLVSGHGGTVYYIEPIKLHGFEERYSILLEEAKQFTTEIERAQLIAFIRLEEENEVKKWYRVLKI